MVHLCPVLSSRLLILIRTARRTRKKFTRSRRMHSLQSPMVLIHRLPLALKNLPHWVNTRVWNLPSSNGSSRMGRAISKPPVMCRSRLSSRLNRLQSFHEPGNSHYFRGYEHENRGRLSRPSVPARTRQDQFARRAFFFLTVFPVLLIIIVAGALAVRSWPILSVYSISDLFFGEIWKPHNGQFGLWPFILGTVWVTT